MKAILFISSILFALLYTVFCEDFKIYDIDKACDCKGAKAEYLLLGNSGIETVAMLKESKSSKIPELDCWITFTTKSPKTKILFSVTTIDFSKNDCDKYYIDALAGPSQRSLAKLCQQRYDSNEPSVYVSEEEQLTFHIVTAKKVHADIQIIVTAYSNTSEGIFNYKFDNNIYISSYLKCDDNNCFGRSDDENDRTFTPGVITVIVIGCLLATAAISVDKEYLKSTYSTKLNMKVILFISSILFALLSTVFCEDYKTYDIDKACGSKGAKAEYPLFENSGRETVAILKEKKFSKIPELDCWITFTTKSPKTKILFSVRKIDFSKNNCDKYYIDALAGPSKKSVAKLCQHKYDIDESTSYLSEEEQLTFHIVTAKKVHADIQIIVTAYSNTSEGIFNFKCDNNIYISSYLKCDYHNNCSDGSDEENCRRFTTGTITAIVIGCLLIIAAISGTIWFLGRKKSVIRTMRRVYT